MKVKKFHSKGEPTEKVTLRVQIENRREQDFLEALFHDNYKLHEIVNKKVDNPFTTQEVKEIGDKFYTALVTNNHV